MEQQMPPQAQPQHEAAEAEQKGGVQQLVEGINSDLMKFAELVSQAEPALAQKMQSVIASFQDVVDTLINGGGQGAPQPKGPMAGGPGAVPAM